MKKTLLLFSILLCIAAVTATAGNPREKLLMDRGWKFHLGSASSAEKDFGYGSEALFAKAGEAYGPVAPDFNDTGWRSLDVPHDWMVEQEFIKSGNPNVLSHGYKPAGRLYPETTIGWYRKAFTLPETDKGRRLRIRFDGVFRDCKVWLNGHYMVSNMSGYSEFGFDVTDYILYGKRNVLVVRADATQYEGWFYEGAGIYRHVWMEKYDPLHITEYGVFVHTVVSNNTAAIFTETEVSNQGEQNKEFELESQVLGPDGKKVDAAISKGLVANSLQDITSKQEMKVIDPRLWSLETPVLYTVVSLVKVDGKVVDSLSTQFGIRTLEFDKDKGFFLNGKRVEVQGVCNHQDHAGVGSALPDRLQYYRIEKLKEMGCNAYRTSHNPPTRELLDACDKLGMLVFDETRLMGSSPEYMGQFERLVLRDRNHPSVFIWSIGNEEWVVQGTETGHNIAQSLIARLKQLDPTRLYSYAGNNGNEWKGVNELVPIRGFNYMNNNADIDKYHKEHPQQILMGSEEASTLCTRGIYTKDSLRGYVPDYDVTHPYWGALAETWWKYYSARPYLLGAFVWTGFDYRGEPTPYEWPCISSHFGIMDVCGFPKNNYYYYKSWWTADDVLHIYPHWNWKGREGDTISVWCNSNCESVELFLNGKSLGPKKMPLNGHLEWKVAYHPGTLEAHGMRSVSKDGKKSLRKIVTKIETTSAPFTIVMAPDRSSIKADGEDVSVVNVSVLDEKGREVPDAMDLIKFELKGDGKIIGAGNGDPSSHETDKCPEGKWQRKLFNGKCQLIVQSGRAAGSLILTATSENTKPSTSVISVADAKVREGL
ncbi:MAG: beta-galactosidase GalA [Bacteroidota bacterium]